MNALLVIAAVFVTATYANTPYRYDDDEKYYQESVNKFAKGKEYRYEVKDKSTGYKDDDYSVKGAYGSVKEYS